MSILILMATYNGEKYIREQLDSLLGQTEQNFHVEIGDDNSTDSTWQILSEYAKKYSTKIHIARNQPPRGAKHNFMNLMLKYKDDYVMLCDQDDVWLNTKIAHTLGRMKQLEAEYGRNTPILVHTDLRVVDEKLNVVCPSYRDMMSADNSRTALKHEIIQNTLTGCTAMYNRALADLIVKRPKYCVMHDWWLMLTASAFGKISVMDEQTILYRQHGNNEMGAKEMKSFSYMLSRFLFDAAGIRKAIYETYGQAQSFLDVYGGFLSDEQRKFLADYTKIPSCCKMNRLFKLHRLGVKKNGWVRRLAYMLFV